FHRETIQVKLPVRKNGVFCDKNLFWKITKMMSVLIVGSQAIRVYHRYRKCINGCTPLIIINGIHRQGKRVGVRNGYSLSLPEGTIQVLNIILPTAFIKVFC